MDTTNKIVSAAGVSNDFLQLVLQKYCSDFHGVYSCDNIPVNILVKKKRYSIICNLSPANHPGSHFISITVGDKGIVTYCDPLIIPPEISPDIAKFLVTACRGASAAWGKGKKIRKNRGEIHTVPARAVQHPRSTFCGFFAMAYLLYFDSNVSGKPDGGLDFEAVREKSPSDVNEDKCLRYILDMIKATRPLR